MDIHFVTNIGALLNSTPGTALWDEDFSHMSFQCPCACGHVAGINFQPKHANGWTWDGNQTKPTVTPSIAIQPCGWHGYLTAGRWVKA